MTKPNPGGEQPSSRGPAADEASTSPAPEGTSWLALIRLLTRRQGASLVRVACVVAVALVTGCLSPTSSSPGSEKARTAHRNLQPFREAVAALTTAPGLRYKHTPAFGTAESEITVTAGGSQFGTTSSSRYGTGQDVLRIGGRTFTRRQVGRAPEQGAAGKKAPPGEWTTGPDAGSPLTEEALARSVTPAKLAAVLGKALDDLERSPQPVNEPKPSSTSGRRQLNVNGTPALGVDTSAGRLLVTKERPHRVLRLEAYDPRDELAATRDRLKRGEAPAAPRRVTTGPLASGGTGGIDLTPIAADAAGEMFDTLVEYADQLKNATARGITFTLTGKGTLKCGRSGCTATRNFIGRLSSVDRDQRVTKGRVTAVMSATFSIDGRPAGRCTSPRRTFTVRGDTASGTLRCFNPRAGRVYSSVLARHKALARIQARLCRCPVPYSFPLRADTVIKALALASVEAERLAGRARIERDAAACVRHSFPSGTRVLLADGTSRAIEDIRVGDRIAAGDPRTGRTVPRRVTDTFTTEDDRDFTRITITTGHGPATITATDDHPFWVEGDRRWKAAGDLRVGDELRTANGTGVAVTEVRDQQGPRRTHDLTVSGPHTYHVLAGATPVLVHNDDKKKECLNRNSLTRQQADDIARYLGYTKTKRVSAAKQAIWENRKAGAGQPRYITFDRTGHHKEAVFKGSDSRDAFQSTKSSARDGTYGLDIGPNGELRGLKWLKK